MMKVTTLTPNEMSHWDAIRNGVKEHFGIELWSTAKEHWHLITARDVVGLEIVLIKAYIAGFFCRVKVEAVSE